MFTHHHYHLLLLLHLLFAIANAGSLAPSAGRRLSARLRSTSETSSSSLYECELSYLQVDNSLIKFSINHLIVNANDRRQLNKTIVVEEADFKLDQIAYNSTLEELQAGTQLDPNLPFIFFINGFNTLNEGEADLERCLLCHMPLRVFVHSAG